MAVDFLFVVPPFNPAQFPALGVSLLKSNLQEHGFSSKVMYLSLDYAAQISYNLYSFIGNFPSGCFLGEVLFTKSLWGEDSVPWQQYLQDNNVLGPSRAITKVKRQYRINKDSVFLLEHTFKKLFENSPEVIQKWAAEIVRQKPRIVGISSIFHQNIASLALAKALRALVPKSELTIVMGGANCAGRMGQAIAEKFDFIDHVVSGEADSIISDLTRKILSGQNDCPRFIRGIPVSDMDALPMPDFVDYFDTLESKGLSVNPSLTAETARGCWWGMRHPCKFCGLNGTTRDYRSKSPERAIQELQFLSDRYALKHFQVTDNIMDMKYLHSLIPHLKNSDLSFMYETKSNLTKKQLGKMVEAGIKCIQPGIESLSTPVLKLMRKGTTCIQNVQLLKFCKKFNIGAHWNMLYGFPRENLADYDKMIALIPHLVHLAPPQTVAPMNLALFSVYFDNAEAEGITNIKPFTSYSAMYPPFSPEDIAHIANVFIASPMNDPIPYREQLEQVMEEWDKRYREKAQLQFFEYQARYWIRDTRYGRHAPAYPLSTLAYKLLNMFESICSVDAVIEEAVQKRLATGPAITSALALFRDKHWIIEEQNKALSLVM